MCACQYYIFHNKWGTHKTELKRVLAFYALVMTSRRQQDSCPDGLYETQIISPRISHFIEAKTLLLERKKAGGHMILTKDAKQFWRTLTHFIYLVFFSNLIALEELGSSEYIINCFRKRSSTLLDASNREC